MFDCRLIIDPPATGVRNMSVDEALLIDAAEHNTATLRFYSWIEPTLSLGYFQRYADRQQHAASSNCAIVRRQTGGGAILHDRELTYSLSLPSTHPLAKQNEKLYRIVHEVFVEILRPTADDSTSDQSLQIRGESDKLSPADEPFLCFQRRSPGDVVLVSNATASGNATLSPTPMLGNTHKILGSAQRRYHGAVLQHGSLLLKRSPAAPELTGWSDLVETAVDAKSVISASANQLANILELRLHPAKLHAELESKAAQIANNKYGSAEWTKRR